MLKGFKLCINVLVLGGMLFPTIATAATARPKSVVNYYHPKNNCELIGAIESANASLRSSIINLGGRTFELTDDCATAAAACPAIPPVSVAGCFADGVSYAHGPTGLPEIVNGMDIINGRIVRSTQADPFRIFTITSGALSLFKVTLENGDAESVVEENISGKLASDPGNGGAVYLDQNASLKLLNSKIGFNHAAASGGGVYAFCDSRLNVLSSLISHNSADAEDLGNPQAGGGGIYIAAIGTSIVNFKQAPFGFPGLENLINSTVSHNTTPGLGGGLNNQGVVGNILDSTFSYNSACVTLPGSGECDPEASTVGLGGGIYNGFEAFFLKATQTTFWGNHAFVGGGIYNGQNVNTPPFGIYLNNNTVANNFAETGGGGLYNAGYINQLVSNLIAANTDVSDQSVDLFSSALDINIVPLVIPVEGVISEGYNLIGDCSGSCGLTNDVNLDIVGGENNQTLTLPVIDPRLHDLMNNGGPTETAALFPDSPAVNNGYNNFKLSFDQRGPSYFRTVSQTDIGAYEYPYDGQ